MTAASIRIFVLSPDPVIARGGLHFQLHDRICGADGRKTGGIAAYTSKRIYEHIDEEIAFARGKPAAI